MAFFMNSFKYTIFLVNLIFFGLGIYLSYEAYSQLGNEIFNLDSALKSPIYFTFVIAIIVVLISFLGCCGTSQESPCMIKSYAGLILLCILLQIAAVVMIARTDPDQVANQIKKNVFSKFESQSKSVQRTIQIFQDANKCCAIDNWDEYGDVSKVPNSCCNQYNDKAKDSDTQIGACKPQSLANVPGCKGKFTSFVHENYKTVYIVVGCIFGFQLLVVILSCVLSKNIREQYNVV